MSRRPYGAAAAASLVGVLAAGCSLAPPVVVTTGADVGFSFHAYGYPIRDVPRALYPYARRTPIAERDPEPHDASGVRMARVNGRLYDHPVAQASFGLNNLESYRITRNAFYLRRAQAQADRLLARGRRVGGALYLPYPFSFDLHGLATERAAAPWYSAMAQGQALSLFVRLAETTDDARYRTAADQVFASFLRPRGTATPWTVWVDHGGYLWLEEYASPRPDRTYNGQLFAAWGLWDYWRTTNDERARTLWDGALSTVVAYAPTIRNPGWVSSYCLNHPWSVVETYHLIHISQFVTMWTLTGHPAFSRWAETFLADYPPPDVAGRVRFAGGSYYGYRFDGTGHVTAARQVTLGRQSVATTDRQVRIKGRPGLWYRITAGALRGYYVAARPPRVVLIGGHLPITWSPTRTARLTAGRTVVGRVFAASGAVTASRRFTPTAATTFAVSRTEEWNGARYALADDGPLAGHWIPLTTLTFA